MKNIQNKKTLQIVLVVLIAILTLGIGYASISAINLIINGNGTASANQESFKVYFIQTADTPSITGNVTLTGSATINNEDNIKEEFNVSGLTKVGDYALATYTIINNSSDTDNSRYFNCSAVGISVSVDVYGKVSASDSGGCCYVSNTGNADCNI